MNHLGLNPMPTQKPRNPHTISTLASDAHGRSPEATGTTPKEPGADDPKSARPTSSEQRRTARPQKRDPTTRATVQRRRGAPQTSPLRGGTAGTTNATGPEQRASKPQRGTGGDRAPKCRDNEQGGEKEGTKKKDKREETGSSVLTTGDRRRTGRCRQVGSVNPDFTTKSSNDVGRMARRTETIRRNGRLPSRSRLGKFSTPYRIVLSTAFPELAESPAPGR